MEKKLTSIKRIENRSKQIPGAISLAQGIPSFSCHPLIQEGVIEAIKNNLVDKCSPVSGVLELRNLISEKLFIRGMRYNPENEIIVSAGGIEALSATMLSLLDSGDEVIILTPAYPNYEGIIRMAKGKPVSVPLSEKNGWSLDLNLLKKKINGRTKAIIICNPNNPTGSTLSLKDLSTIGILAQRHKFFIITDDIYENLYFGDTQLFNICTLHQYKKHIIRIVSLSKDLALSGWRIGFIHADKEVIAKILPIHDNLINCAPVVSQYAALTALKHDKIILDEFMEQYKRRRKVMGEALETLTPYMTFHWPEGSYYFFPKISGVTNTERLCTDILEQVRVACVPGEDFGLGGKGHIRLCFGKTENEIVEGMKRLNYYFTQVFTHNSSE